MFSPQLGLVMAGAALGGGLRHVLGQWIQQWAGGAYPWHTLAINLSGAFALALLMGLGLQRQEDFHSLRLFLGVGLLGGYTTFSSFAWEGLGLLERGLWTHALVYLVGSALLGLGAAVAGLALGKWMA